MTERFWEAGEIECDFEAQIRDLISEHVEYAIKKLIADSDLLIFGSEESDYEICFYGWDEAKGFDLEASLMGAIDSGDSNEGLRSILQRVIDAITSTDPVSSPAASAELPAGSG